MKTTLMFIYTESSLHAGTGSSVSVVDLPIQRERTTQYPIVQGSGVKGALRSQANRPDDEIDAIFGYMKDVKGENGVTKQESTAGAIAVGEAQTLLFPVRSLAGVFAYVTSAFAIARLRRDLESMGITPPFADVKAPETGNALVTTGSRVTVGGSTVLDEFTFTVQADENVTKLARWLAENALSQDGGYAYWRQKIQDSLIVLPENDFRDFVVNSTEIVTRVRLETATKTVAEGALWTQEMLPADTLMYSAVIVRKPRKHVSKLETPEEVIGWLKEPKNISTRIQLGGDETTGAGMVALKWFGQ